ncbi:uncharacterized protein F4812DRAFT_469899 [Daldinia caldariorum]|uniref:uncharacterized protein n=1 Tax=Daldinia caldariorum TaxID=326644 RepID=UPI002007F86E|nr:uncharacterized protein F4812DRAFT_469899 [Daldinia caldariorum]KAI1469853.1 hypothetical protein F4812DRAFT_469899 [Daldinia caldariorum]
MDNKPVSRGNNPTLVSSWANVVKNQNQDDNANEMVHGTPLGNARMSFKPKGTYKKPNTQPGQRDHSMTLPIHPGQSLVSTPATFKGQYLQQVQATRQQVNQKFDLEHGAVQLKDVQDTPSLNLELASMKATVSTLQEDLSRKNGDLIQARAALASKDMQIKDLQDAVEMLKENIRSINAAAQTGEDKDELIAKLECENAELRDSIHTGIISISQVYGPGSDQAFIHMAANQTGDSWSTPKNSANGRQDYQNSGQTMRVQSPSHPQQALKQVNGAHHGQPMRPTANSKKPEVQKENKSSKHAHQLSNVRNRSNKDGHQTVTTTHLPTSQIGNSLKDVSSPIDATQHIEVSEPLKKAEQVVESAKDLIQNQSETAGDSHGLSKTDPSVNTNNCTEVSHSSVQKDNESISDSKTLSDNDPSVVGRSSTPANDNKVNDLIHTATDETSTSDTETNNETCDLKESEDKTNGDLGAEEVSGKYRSKGIQESVNIMDGAPLVDEVDEHLKSTDPQAHDQPVQIGTGLVFLKPLSHRIEEGRTEHSDDVSSPPANSKGPAVLPAKESEHPAENLEENDGWVDVAAKSKMNKQSKSKVKGNPKKSPTPSENGKSGGEQKLAQKPVPKEKGIPATLQKRRGKKNPGGTIIGSNSIFSRAAKEQPDEGEVAIKEISMDTKQSKTISPNPPTPPLSWADEVEEEEEARRKC